MLTDGRQCVLASRRPDGSLQLNPVVVIGGRGDVALIATRAAAYKIKNIAHDPRVGLCVPPRRTWGGDWAQIDGYATVHRPPAATDEIAEYYERVDRPGFTPETVRRLCARGELVLIRILFERAVPDTPPGILEGGRDRSDSDR
ncbi:pyridoxamine 5'-phosphate oxidase family protein [Micromonospora zhanjiangensis]